ncbi:MAG TPA: HAMP domain-containing histidine kinase, partial [Hellea balneolensis]|nr:HAMP domain-containing histidine kinase [Hellea balneolensis]
FGPLGDPRYKEYVNDILFSGQHLLALINDILDMSKIEAGKMVLNTEIMFMHEMVEQVVRIVRGKAEEAQLNLVTDIQPVKEIEADPRAVKQVLLNLMTNAIKFTPEGGTVSVSVAEKQTGLIISVSDTGIGISEENIERLAKPFEQVIDRNTKSKEGTGLGLVLSKSLVELHGGNFKINSEVDVGTTVTFTLPNTPAPPKEEEPEVTDVSNEFSKLADDIADILETSENEAMVDEGTVSYAYQQPVFTEETPDEQYHHDETGNSRPAA